MNTYFLIMLVTHGIKKPNQTMWFYSSAKKIGLNFSISIYAVSNVTSSVFFNK